MSNNLPPLPTPEAWRTRVGPWGDHSTDYAYTVNQMRAYAAVAVAERDAEIARLRGENKALQDGIVRDFVDVGIKNVITELRAEVEALKADAERYRWLRDNSATYTSPKIPIQLIAQESWASQHDGYRAHLDAAIDNARSEG